MATTEHPTHQPASLSLYFITFGMLMLLTILTIFAGFQNFGMWSTPIALGIAAVKAALVVVIFMHGYSSSPLIWIIILASMFFLTIMLGLMLSDYVSRGWLL
ncbi:MAG: oxidase [Planctomycetes bacterium]|nr:oxidase [Planctomycetota bacterium]NBY01823.1 oxidase [Planctomycetota bacterium]